MKIMGQAERESASFYSVFNQSPELYIFLKQLKALEASTKEKTTLILDPQTAPFNLLNSQSGSQVPAAKPAAK